MKYTLLLVFFVGYVCSFNVGSGIYDITGPAAQTGMMGYAMANQTSAGIHFRLRARAYIFEDPQTFKRVVFVSTDSCMIFTGVKQEVVTRLQAQFGKNYTVDNVLLSGIHTHSGPGGYAEYAIFDITTLGFYKENFETIVQGIVNAISMAHNSLKSNLSIYYNSGTLLDSNINRSPSAYLNNPAEERAKYKYNVDKEMSLLKITDSKGQDFGMLNWFAVHGTSMTNQNTLISGDNKGYASYLFEKSKNGNSTLPGKGPFIAIFGQANEGDVSPNTLGAFCNNGLPCDFAHSTCGGTSEGCHGYGPGKNDFQSAEIIGANQFKSASDLYDTAKIEITGPIDFIHTFVDMTNLVVDAKFSINNQTVKTCMTALGDSFAGGTTDGPGDFNFVQGTNNSNTNAYWNYIASFLATPSEEVKQCQYPKPILLYTGGIDLPTPWEPTILPIQILRIGQFFIVGVPGEFTTMSGRRLRDTISQSLIDGGLKGEFYVVIAGLSNAYSHYITTNEEFHVQRYEGASTLYGPHTLEGYQQEYYKLAQHLISGVPVPPGPTPPNLSGDWLPLFLEPVIEDRPPVLGKFGDVHQDVNSICRIGDIAKVSFWGANPRNNFMTEKTFLSVEVETQNGWTVIANDGNWETKFYWESVWVLESLITVTWEIPVGTPSGRYRIRHFGVSKDIFGAFTPYTGTSSTFSVL
eukprot:TRINITY_DN3575_c0_g1_i1.p1 TRINITY_DN3575_c0_g1~~TRINITY_DN3575_c0_g1_i1.p1  ORF type:complete len:691 (-),score=167.31 TRINITY_DN3575_c0_g1_i1:59-2131(-)